VLGCIYGGVAAYFGGKVDTFMMRIVEILISVPYLIVVIVLSLVLDSKGLFTLLLAMCITGWCGMARLVRAQMLAIKSEEFILAAQALGVKTVEDYHAPHDSKYTQ
ncbi:Binding-protein-dependent transport system inner membrane component, partial [gut metagenome]